MNTPAQRDLTVTEGSLSTFVQLGRPGFQSFWYPTSQSSERDGLASRTTLTGPPAGCYSRPVFTQRPSLRCPSAVSTGQLWGIYLSRFSSCNYSFSFTMECYTLFGATSHTWQPTEVIICPVFLSFRLSFKTGTGLCFCWSLPFSPCYRVQPPLCWRPRKFWTAALFASRDWCKVFKVKSVGLFFFFKIEFTRNKTSSCSRGPCRPLQNFAKTDSLDLASLRFANVLETTWQKTVSARATMRLSLDFIYFIFFFFMFSFWHR